MTTLDQDRAKQAYEHVLPFAEGGARSEDKKKYATLVHKLPALISGAGLCQALHFIQSRNERAGVDLLSQLAAQLARINPTIRSSSDLLRRAREAELAEYLHLTRESLACAAWYRRMVQGVLKVDMAASDEASS